MSNSLRPPWTAAHQASLSITNSRSLLKLMSIESVIPSSHLILCRPLLLPSTFRSLRVFSNESVLHIRWPTKHPRISPIQPKVCVEQHRHMSVGMSLEFTSQSLTERGSGDWQQLQGAEESQPVSHDHCSRVHLPTGCWHVDD